MTKNNTKTTSIIAITFIALLMLIPMNMPVSEAVTSTVLTPISTQTGYVGMSGPSCETSAATTTTGTDSIWIGPRLYNPSISAAGCNRAFVSWDISQVNQTVNSAKLSFDVQPDSHTLHNNNVSGVIHEVTNNISTASASIIQTDIADGTLYLSANNTFSQVGVQTVNLNQNFINDLNDNTNGVIRVGIISSNESTTAFNLAELKNVTLELTFDDPSQVVTIAELQSQILTMNATINQLDTKITALESSSPTYYMVQGTAKTIPASSNSQYATVSCNIGDIAISGSYNINGQVDGINGIRISNSVQTSDGNGWYIRMNNVSSDAAQFTPAVLCVRY